MFRPTIVAFVLMLGIVLAAPSNAGAAELAEQAHSLRAAPADAAFYSASLRLREQWDAFLQSKAYARLMEIPVVQLAKMQAAFQWQQSADPNVVQVREYVESPQGQDAVAVLKEMFAEEIFVYGGADVARSFKVLMDLNSVQRTARLEAQARGEDFEQVMAERVREILQKNADDIQVPTLVMGFRIQNAERARRQLDEIHGLVRNLLDEHRPELSPHLQRDQIGGQEFLTLRLDGSMIPWDEIREEAGEEDEENQEEVEQWRELVSTKTLAIALGVTDEFVLLAIGPSTDHLEKLGETPSLAEQPALQTLNQHAGQRVASVGYVSEAFARSLSSPERTLEDLAETVDEILQHAEVEDEHRDALVEDVRAIDLAKYVPAPGYTATIVFLTPRGYEGYQYQSGARPRLDSSKPLTILNQLGGSPMLLIAGRAKDTVEDYDEAIAWLRRTAGHVEQIAESKTDVDVWAKYLEYRDRGLALLRRLNRANREMLYPALADGQTACVLDVTATSQQWTERMPRSPKPLPMLEVGVVAMVSDAERLRKAVAEYFAVIGEAITLVRDIDPDRVPELELPRPREREASDGGTLFVYPLPKEWRIDRQVAPNAGLTDTAAVVSTMPATSERLLQPTPLEIDTGLDFNRPAARVVHFECWKLVNAIRPWVDYGFEVAMGKLRTDEDDDEDPPPAQSPMVLQMGFIVPQIHQFLEVTTALRSHSSVTYQENGLWVTHSETHFEDLK